MRRNKKSNFGQNHGQPTAERKEKVKVKIYPDHKAANIVREAFLETFWQTGFEWQGLVTEVLPQESYTYHQQQHYLDDLIDSVLFEDTMRKMLTRLQKEEKIEWWELIKQNPVWDDKKEMLVLRCK